MKSSPKCPKHGVAMVVRGAGREMFVGCPLCPERAGTGIVLDTAPRRTYNADGSRPSDIVARVEPTRIEGVRRP